jgi:hypothetical protein
VSSPDPLAVAGAEHVTQQALFDREHEGRRCARLVVGPTVAQRLLQFRQPVVHHRVGREVGEAPRLLDGERIGRGEQRRYGCDAGACI